MYRSLTTTDDWERSATRCGVHGVGGQGRERPVLMVSRSAHMLDLIDQLERVARSNATVLLLGESGTGKEVIAQRIHRCSPRRNGPFVSVNCAALSDGILESELFGHEKGAFTGAVRQRPGRFELADGGTLLLDEVGAADDKVQQRLLRVLQERRFERVGGTRTLRTDVRIVAATNADLQARAAAGAFREDLYYRLNVLPLELPPLRERPEDIPLFIEHFLQTITASEGRNPMDIETAALDALHEYPWPGNIRQLENVLERMVIMSPSDTLTRSDIPDDILDWRDEEGLVSGSVTYKEARDRFERQFLSRALRRHAGVISHAAEAIGLSRKHMYVRLEQLRIDYSRYRRPGRRPGRTPGTD